MAGGRQESNEILVNHWCENYCRLKRVSFCYILLRRCIVTAIIMDSKCFLSEIHCKVVF